MSFDWNKLFTTISYGAVLAVGIMATAGVGSIPIAIVGAVGALSGKMAASHSDSINLDAVTSAMTAQSAGAAAAASSKATGK